MHILTDEQLKERQASEKNLTRDNVIRIPVRRDGKVAGGRKPGDVNIPAFLRPLIGGLAKEGNGAAVARQFDISTERANQLAKGESGNGVDPVLKEQVDEVADSVRNKLIKMSTLKLMATMEAIKEDKLASIESPLVLSGIAKNLASVLERMEKKEEGDGNKFQILIYAPSEKPATEYPSIRVQAKEVDAR